MEKEITLIFHNRELRSYIEVDLCTTCPRLDGKGCCGYYSPVFYPTDFAYLMQKNPDLLEYLFKIPRITVLDSSLTVNSMIDGDSYRCHFHNPEKGCILDQDLRETICRHFVCPGIAWEEEPELKTWRDFFQRLFDYEIYLNQLIAEELKAKSLSLREPQKRPAFFQELFHIFKRETARLPDFIEDYPRKEKFVLQRTIKFGKEWKL
ncbi:hypothetical protein SAMN02745221_01924 [Thermosyntropha lipolytica DSM 11003]|uniref:Uncharacterized protein n=1 Tax=Thermosyntropha lipolytica DSM 11003 TaxID=1123382 RepID=A0A1M5R2Q4_9FIRM|nr:hypothetical protein [Thermosyntropha lipolytica]SHH20644.1 hypothetical protein SAMN02745221_01924 [Thermosyntropha lipolytica DSM 11003]